MDDPRATLEYIGNMAEQLAAMARELGRQRLADQLASAAAVADMDLASSTATGSDFTAH